MLITFKEACRELKIGESTLYQMVEQKLVPVTRVGSKLLRFDLDELIEWFRTGKYEQAKRENISSNKGGIK